MRTIRASEIGTYLYCQRAWWYLSQGTPSQNQREMAEGTEFHYQHGKLTFSVGCLRFVAYSLIILSLAMCALYLTRQLL